MKTLDEIKKTLDGFSKKYGIDVTDTKQGSEAWFRLKLGVISASRASELVAKKDSQTRLNYLCDLVAQVCTGVMEEINSKHMDWGKQHEDAARAYYEFETGFQVVEVPFVYMDDSHREGCSPDGIILGVPRGMETKCPWASENYVKFLVADKIKPEWEWQNQYTMRVMQADAWDFNQYDPRMMAKPMTIRTVKRDLEKQKVLADAAPEFIFDMDKMLKEIGVTFGDQWIQRRATLKVEGF